MTQQFDGEGGHTRRIAGKGVRRGRGHGPAGLGRARHRLGAAAQEEQQSARFFRCQNETPARGQVQFGHSAVGFDYHHPRPATAQRIDARAQQGDRIVHLHEEAMFDCAAQFHPARALDRIAVTGA